MSVIFVPSPGITIFINNRQFSVHRRYAAYKRFEFSLVFSLYKITIFVLKVLHEIRSSKSSDVSETKNKSSNLFYFWFFLVLYF